MAERINQIRDFTFDDSRVRSGAEIAAVVTPINLAYAPLNVWRYMTSAQIADVIARTLTLDCRAAIQTAISVAQQTPGGEVYIPSGAYLINRVASLDSQFNGIWIPYTNVFGYTGSGVKLVGDGQSTTLYAGDNSMTVIRWSDSNGRAADFAIEGNSKTGVTGLSLISSNTGSATIAEHIDWNVFSGLNINGCAEGIELESPSLGGCYYNRFFGVRLYSNTRHIRLRDNATAGGANRNAFYSCNMNSGNTGVYIDGADTCKFFGCTFEAISSGASPLGTPTAIYINNVGTLRGLAPQDNNFIDCIAESCTSDLDCSNNRTYIIGGNIGSVGAVAGSANPNVWIGGDHDIWLREALFGGSGSDSLLVDNRRSGFNATNPMVATTANVAGSYPFENDGSLVLQSRQQSGSGVVIAAGAASDIGLQVTGTGHADFLKCDVGFPQSATSVAILDNGTITTANLTMARVNPAANRTGIIMQSGTQPSQLCVVVNENSTNSITFAASGTSHVSDGASSSVPALTARTFWWDSVQSLWFPSK